jgi:LytTr DNA-binding domain
LHRKCNFAIVFLKVLSIKMSQSGKLNQFIENKILANQLIRHLLISIMVGLLLGAAGAFGTFELPFLLRVLYWVILITIGNYIALGNSKLLDKIEFLDDRIIIYHMIFLTLISLQIAFMTWVLNKIIFSTPFIIGHFYSLLPAVFIVSSFMTLIHAAFAAIPQVSHAKPLENNSPIRFFERLPIKFRNSQIYAIKSEDHYLRIYTNMGETLILMRLYDAINELNGIEGTQTHRSWWVAIDAIARLEKDYGKAKFILKNNIEAPISRSFMPSLKKLKILDN